MRLVNIKIQNYRLLINADLKVDDNTTLIVGRNNTAKTSCVELIDKVLKNNVLSYDDYPSKNEGQFTTFFTTFEVKMIPQAETQYYQGVLRFHQEKLLQFYTK